MLRRQTLNSSFQTKNHRNIDLSINSFQSKKTHKMYVQNKLDLLNQKSMQSDKENLLKGQRRQYNKKCEIQIANKILEGVGEADKSSLIEIELSDVFEKSSEYEKTQYKSINRSEFEQLSQINNASKEMSRIASLQLESQYNQKMLDDYLNDSFAFERKTDSMMRLPIDFDFQIQIQNETDTKYQNRKVVQKQVIKQNDCLKAGKIIKNRSSSSQNKKLITTNIQILFDLMDENKQSRLTYQNCNCNILSTEMKYIFGSLISKIKIMKKTFSFQLFQSEIHQILNQVVEAKELILNFKAEGIKKKNEENNKCKEKSKNTDQTSQRLKKINQKISNYLQNQSNGRRPKSQKVRTTATNIERLGFIRKNRLQESTLDEQPSDIEIIKGLGSTFELRFIELNKHIEDDP